MSDDRGQKSEVILLGQGSPAYGGAEDDQSFGGYKETED